MPDSKKKSDSTDRSAAAKKAAQTRKANAERAERTSAADSPPGPMRQAETPATKSRDALQRQQAEGDEPTRETDKARKLSADYGETLPTDQASGSYGLKPQPHDPVDAPETDEVRKEAKAVTDPPRRKQETVKVHLRDDNPQTKHDVKRLAVLLDGEVTGEGKESLTVKVPLGSDRDPSAARNKLVNGLAADPLVMEVTD